MPPLADYIYIILVTTGCGLTYNEISQKLQNFYPRSIPYDYKTVYNAIYKEWCYDNYVFYSDGGMPNRIFVNPDYYHYGHRICGS